MENRLELGSTISTLTQGELRDELAVHAQETFRQLARGVKYLRIPFTQIPIVSSAFTFDGSTAALGPREGFIWSFTRLAVTGLTSSATPDVAGFFRNRPGGVPIWQVNGNQPFSTFSKLQMMLLPGETLAVASIGNIVATGSVVLSGDYVEVAAEEVFKLF